MIALTDVATEKVRELIEAEGEIDLALRVAVRPGGCSGYSYEMFFDSETVSKLKHLIKVLPDTPEDQLADDVIEMLEGTSMAFLIPGVIKGFQFVKKLPKETVSDVAKITASGAVIAGAVKAKSDEKPTIDVSKKEIMKN